MHEAYGGVVPELASRDHIRRVVPLAEQVLARGGRWRLRDLDGIAYTRGPGTRRRAAGRRQRRQRARALRCGKPASASTISKATCCRRCSPSRGRRSRSSRCWFPAATASFRGRGRRALSAARRHAGRRGRRGVRQDGEAARPAVSRAGRRWRARRVGARRAPSSLPRPMLDSGDLDISFSRLKTAVLTLVRRREARRRRSRDSAQGRHRARVPGRGRRRAGREGARRRSTRPARDAGRRGRRRREPRAARAARREAWRARGGEVFFPDLAFCTDNGAMIALVGALRLRAARRAATTRSPCGRAGSSASLAAPAERRACARSAADRAAPAPVEAAAGCWRDGARTAAARSAPAPTRSSVLPKT